IPVRLRREGFARSSSIQPFHSEVSFLHAAGISDESVENTTGQTFLRGYQITDSNGAVTFKTVVPGWYSGRTIHINVMIRTLSSSGSVLTEFTTQLFFDQTLPERSQEAPFLRTVCGECRIPRTLKTASIAAKPS